MRLEITCQDRLGITQDVLDILVKYSIDLRGIEIDSVGKIYLSFPTIEFAEFQHLMPEIRKLSGVTDVKTTPFMPIERERNELTAILETLPDPVFSVDAKGKVTLTNEAAASCLDLQQSALVGGHISDIVKGFNFVKWLEGRNVTSTSNKIKFVEQDYLADMFPVFVPDSNKSRILAGAVVLLKSELRLGQQFSVFHQSSDEGFNHIYANSTAMKKVVRETRRLSESHQPLLIFGESGTGKEVFARACHNVSKRGEMAFHSFSFAGKDDDTCTKALFSGENDEPGMLFDSNIGTLLLNELSDMSRVIQDKLHSYVETYMADPATMPADAKRDFPRLIATTQSDLGQLVADGRFREDLFYGLNVLNLLIPPLRDRKQDIVGLSEMFIKQHAARLGKRPPKLSKSCIEFLTSYPWPGNVRQLESALFRSVSTLVGREIHKEDIQLPSSASVISFSSSEIEGTLDEEVKKFEKSLLRKLYPSYPSTRQLAKKLGLSHTAIANKLREYGINRKTVKV